VTLTVYLAVCFGIGWHFRRRASQDVSSYYVAKREAPGWVVSLAFFSTFISTNTYIGQAGEAFAAGLSWAWVGVFWTVFCMMSWLLLGPRLRNQTAGLGSLTVPDYFDFRYKSPLSKATRILSALTILFATIWYMAGIAKGSAHLLEIVLGVPYVWGALATIVFTCAYTVLGGMYGVLWTDAIQGAIMFFVALLMASLPFIYAGGPTELMARISNTSHVSAAGAPIGDGLVTFCSLVSFTYILGIGLSVGMKQVAEPRCLVRFYSVDNAKSMRFAMIWTPVFLGVSLVSIMGLGALVHGMATEQEAAYLVTHTDEVVGFMLAKFDNTAVSAICITGLFAAGMSSLASVMLIVGTAVVGDIWNIWKPMQPKQMVRWTKLSILAYSAIVFAITIFPPAGIVEMTSFSGAVFVASFFPALFGGLYLRWGTGHGAFWSMLLGMAATLLWRFGIRFHVAGMEEIHEIIPAFCISVVVYIVVSRLTAAHRPDEAHLDSLFSEKANG
jgi:Na+/proline symporter